MESVDMDVVLPPLVASLTACGVAVVAALQCGSKSSKSKPPAKSARHRSKSRSSKSQRSGKRSKGSRSSKSSKGSKRSSKRSRSKSASKSSKSAKSKKRSSSSKSSKSRKSASSKVKKVGPAGAAAEKRSTRSSKRGPGSEGSKRDSKRSSSKAKPQRARPVVSTGDSSKKSGQPLNPKQLSVEPRELRFPSLGGVLSLKLRNAGPQTVAVKVKCSDCNLYRVNPVYQLVEPGATADIQVLRQNGPSKVDKLILVFAKAPAGCVDGRNCFRGAGDYPMQVVPLLL